MCRCRIQDGAGSCYRSSAADHRLDFIRNRVVEEGPIAAYVTPRRALPGPFSPVEKPMLPICRSWNMNMNMETWNIGSGGAVAVDPGIGPAVEAAIAISQATPRRHAAGIGRLLGRSTRRH